jgi:immunity protein 27 of polymorphic toxin system
MNLPDELVGNWIADPSGRMVGDGVERSIREAVQNRLTKIAARDGGWTILYRDPTDGSYFELTFPQGEMQGGGPARLSRIEVEQVRRHYPDVTLP